MSATDRQIAYITKLAADRGFDSNISAIDAYGFGLKAARDLTGTEASEMIGWLKGDKSEAVAPVASAKAPVRTTNKGGRVGQRATTRSGLVGTVVSDAGKRVRIQLSDGSIGSFDPATVTFAA